MGYLELKIQFQDMGFGTPRTVTSGLYARPSTCGQPLVCEQLAVPVKDHVPHLVSGIHVVDYVTSVSSKIPVQSFCIGCRDRLGCHSAAPCLGHLGFLLVQLLASNVNLVDLYGTWQHCLSVAEHFADSLESMPRGLHGDH